MMMAYQDDKPPSYKSYKAAKFHKYNERQKALIQGVMESSLKPDDKAKLLYEMAEGFLNKINEIMK